MSSNAEKCPVMGMAPSKISSVGPQDIYTLEALSHFNREKIPERAVHALGAGAYGEFEVTHDISDICNIESLLGVGKKTEVMTRFSTTGLERGSSDSVQDLKGMATKFFTKDGEWDWVFLNFPFFFIRDPAKFPEMIHAQRRDPQTNRPNPNMLWKFVSENHESLHMTLLQFSDFGRMFTWRTMSSYSGHAFKWVMADGSFKYAHFFLASERGPNFENGSIANIDSSDPDAASKDLFEAIERGENPSWIAKVQLVDPKDAPNLGFNILDVTKHWNLGTYPTGVKLLEPREFGRLTLNRNVTDYFREVEQRAFSPSNLVPGIEASEDPILQARMFAYPDAQRYRLPITQQPTPRARTPSALGPQSALGPEFVEWLAETSSAAWSQSNEDDYRFAREYYEVLPSFRGQEFQDRLVERLIGSIAQTCPEIREKVYHAFSLLSLELADKVKRGVHEVDGIQNQASQPKL
ncbi:CAZyme family AA7 [Penicillium macrosclerotiorum]|uniref:CAZyme family AA7 n=1 Tax=Penicillium macrosclerotiorum TaxID=303699 RepID=UPI002546EF49|nr:CAZyme family AA7 [Penicillium macrosclerotiorum]KAJ5673932.1 CAZyme family AA7 [Penicillium macrosclerotiorum]